MTVRQYEADAALDGNERGDLSLALRPGDVAGARLDQLETMKVPIFAVTVDPVGPSSAPPTSAPLPGQVAEYVVAGLDRESLRGRFFPHVIDRCKGIEVAVGRRLPAMRETVGSNMRPRRYSFCSTNVQKLNNKSRP